MDGFKRTEAGNLTDEGIRQYLQAKFKRVTKIEDQRIKKLKAELKKKDELLWAYESVRAPINPLIAENKRLREAYENIRTYLMEKINEKNGYIKTMKRMAKNDEYYDQAQTNIMEIEEQLIEYNWINNKIEQALKGKSEKD